MAPTRIADCRQDTASLKEPCYGEIFSLAWWNARRNCVLQVADGWKAAHRDCAATKRRLRHVWGGRKSSMMADAPRVARRPGRLSMMKRETCEKSLEGK